MSLSNYQYFLWKDYRFITAAWQHLSCWQYPNGLMFQHRVHWDLFISLFTGLNLKGQKFCPGQTKNLN
ncbi:hypothetical protein [Photorhabdus akhurstii]|uniref:hypothetical protein n=1 Tax=Photorhabdus akhurstii TaxID=171438 RepID=UPI003704C2DD